MDEDFDKKTKVSEFNEAGYQILRLHGLWTKCNYYATKGLLDEWKWALDRIWVELSADTKDKKQNYSDKNKLLNLKIASARNNNEFYDRLQEKEVFLRSLQEAVGKGSKKSLQYESLM